MNNWKNYNFLTTLSIGSYVDVMDNQGMWRLGKIYEILKDNKDNKVTISFDGWNHTWDEVII